jgi:hypothetical protein
MRFAKKALAYILAGSFCLVSLCGAGDPESLDRAETQISRLFTQMAASKTDADKQKINDSIVRLMDVALQTAGSMDYPFARLHKMGKISSTDSKIRIYTWNLPLSDGTNTYFGYLQYRTKNKGEIKQVFLNDKSADMPDASMGILSPSQWYGMLIYEIIETKDGENSYYTLLGLDNRDLFVSCKIADVLYFDNHSEPVFGRPIFHYQNKLMCRVIFQYSAKVKMSLTWNPKLKMIISDHLAPPNSSYAGNYAFYGPDLSYDGFRFEDGKWELVEKVDVRN